MRSPFLEESGPIFVDVVKVKKVSPTADWKTVSIKIPPELHAQVVAGCKAAGISPPTWVRRLITDTLGVERLPERKTKPKKKTRLELVEAELAEMRSRKT